MCFCEEEAWGGQRISILKNGFRLSDLFDQMKPSSREQLFKLLYFVFSIDISKNSNVLEFFCDKGFRNRTINWKKYYEVHLCPYLHSVGQSTTKWEMEWAAKWN